MKVISSAVGKNKEEIIRGRQRNRRRDRQNEDWRRGERTVIVKKRRCINSVSTEAFEIFRQRGMSESGGISWCDLWDDSCGVSDCWDWRVGLWCLLRLMCLFPVLRW